ncbi:MAG: hypothetical protein NC211_02750 [Alistipes senegalensis]|nr:hypothetical protein [Alistipes senegalensis]
MPNPSLENPLFRPLGWLPDSAFNTSSEFLAFVSRDIADGLQLLFEIIEKESISREAKEPCIFCDCDISRITRLGIASANLLYESAKEICNSIQEGRHA